MKEILFRTIFVGAVLGILSAKWDFSGSWLNLLPWGIAAIVLGFSAKNRREALWSGVVYGAVLSVTFLFVGANDIDFVTGFIVFLVLGGIVGALGGLALTWFGNLLRRRRAN